MYENNDTVIFLRCELYSASRGLLEFQERAVLFDGAAPEWIQLIELTDDFLSAFDIENVKHVSGFAAGTTKHYWITALLTGTDEIVRIRRPVQASSSSK
mgnify:CR=1 FL=1